MSLSKRRRYRWRLADPKGLHVTRAFQPVKTPSSLETFFFDRMLLKMLPDELGVCFRLDVSGLAVMNHLVGRRNGAQFDKSATTRPKKPFQSFINKQLNPF